MTIHVIHHIKLEDTPALCKLLNCLCKCGDDEQTKQEIMDKLNAIQKDLEATVPDEVSK